MISFKEKNIHMFPQIEFSLIIVCFKQLIKFIRSLKVQIFDIYD